MGSHLEKWQRRWEHNIKMYVKDTGSEIDGPTSGLCSMADFRFRGYEPSGSTARDLD